MPREKEAFRDNLARLDAAFPGRELLIREDLCKWLGICRNTFVKMYPFEGKYISKAEMARRLCL